MLFNSLTFVVFFALLLALHNAPLSWTTKKTNLLIASYLFYAAWNPPFVILLWISTVIDWNVAKKIFTEQSKNRRKMWLAISVVVNLGLLGYFKYGGFLLDNFVALAATAGINYQPPEWLKGALENRDAQIERAVAATKKLQDRGVEVIFVRNPAEGHYAVSEPMYNPRTETWDVLIEQTGALGIHWQDHKELRGYWLPEWSHLSGSEADRYTKALYHVIQRERVKRSESRPE